MRNSWLKPVSVIMASVKSMAVIGTGTMGPGIAQVFAQAGINVNLVDIDQKFLDTAIGRIKDQLKSFQDGGVLDAQQVNGTLSRLTTFINRADAVKDVDYVIEAVPENLELMFALALDPIDHQPESGFSKEHGPPMGGGGGKPPISVMRCDQ